MNFGKIIYNDVANGPGCRTSLFVSGCHRHCKGCFNEETWDFRYGEPFTDFTMRDIMQSLEKPQISGLTILGGEPLAVENIAEVMLICATSKLFHEDKTIWLYTGYTYEDIAGLPFLRHVDILVDGPFVEEKKDLRLQFRGSSNQRIIDVQKSLKTGSVVLWEGLKDRV